MSKTAAVFLAAVSLAACDRNPVESANFDAVGLYRAVAPVVATVEGSPATQTLGVLGPRMSFDSAPGAAPALAAGLFPDAVLGRTFEYDPQAGRYRLSQRPVVPELASNGVRFLLYQVDLARKQPVSPLRENGFTDLTDESAASTTILGVRVVIDATTSLDYDGSVSTGGGMLVFSAKGLVANGSAVADFDLSQVFSATEISVRYSVTGARGEVSLLFQGSVAAGGTTTVKLTVSRAEGSTVVEASGTESAISGQIAHNGTVVARISGSSQNPSFKTPSGKELPADQATALKQLFDAVDDLLAAFDDLLAPAYTILELPV